MVTVKGVLTDMLEQFLKLFIPEGIIHSAEKKQVDNFLPYMDVTSTKNKVKLYKTFKQLLPACDLRVMFNISSRMKTISTSKTKSIKNYVLYIILREPATMLNTFVNPNHST